MISMASSASSPYNSKLAFIESSRIDQTKTSSRLAGITGLASREALLGNSSPWTRSRSIWDRDWSASKHADIEEIHQRRRDDLESGRIGTTLSSARMSGTPDVWPRHSQHIHLAGANSESRGGWDNPGLHGARPNDYISRGAYAQHGLNGIPDSALATPSFSAMRGQSGGLASERPSSGWQTRHPAQPLAQISGNRLAHRTENHPIQLKPNAWNTRMGNDPPRNMQDESVFKPFSDDSVQPLTRPAPAPNTETSNHRHLRLGGDVVLSGSSTADDLQVHYYGSAQTKAGSSFEPLGTYSAKFKSSCLDGLSIHQSPTHDSWSDQISESHLDGRAGNPGNEQAREGAAEAHRLHAGSVSFRPLQESTSHTSFKAHDFVQSRLQGQEPWNGARRHPAQDSETQPAFALPTRQTRFQTPANPFGPEHTFADRHSPNVHQGRYAQSDPLGPACPGSDMSFLCGMPFQSGLPYWASAQQAPRMTSQQALAQAGYYFNGSPHLLSPYHVPGQPQGLEMAGSAYGIRSALLHEYKNFKGSRRWELRDVHEHIVEFCKDLAGSKFIQNKLETANSEQRERVLSEILPHACELMNDVFGNWVMQKFFIRGSESEKKTLMDDMKGKVLSLSKHMYGCRVIQKALKYISEEQRAALVRELEGSVMSLIKDQNGNYVIQKVIKRVPMAYTKTIIEVCVQNVRELAVHWYGCRIVQRLLKHYDGPAKSIVLQELHACAEELIKDQYGNYVTQHIIEHGDLEDKTRMMEVVHKNLVFHAKQRFASNVVEKCITCGSEAQRRDIMLTLSAKDHTGSSLLPTLVRDSYANYVIQKLLETLDSTNFATFVALLAPEMNRMKRSLNPCKEAENVHKKMLRFERPYPYHSTMRIGLYPPAPTPPSASDNLNALYSISRL